MIFTIEGNVGAGKTTLLKQLEEKNTAYTILYEPVDEWMNFRSEGSDKSLFELFYEDKKKYGFVFQMMALQSRFENLQKTIEENVGKIIVCERSFLTDCEIFAKLNNTEGNISDVEFHVYKKWHAFFMRILKPDIKGLIYLRVEPEVCKQRIEKRHRLGENAFSDVYLEKLHECHEAWLGDQTVAPTLHVDGNGTADIDSIIEFIESRSTSNV